MYVQRMLSHQRKLAQTSRTRKPLYERPKAAFEEGTRRTPRPAHQPVWHRPEFVEVHQAFRRTLLAKPTLDDTNAAVEQGLAHKISRNRALSDKKAMFERRQHAIAIRHTLRRMEESYSTHERKKNRFDTELFPARIMRRSDSVPAGYLRAEHPGRMWQEAAIEEMQRPRSARASSGRPPLETPRTAARPASAAPTAARPSSARPSTAGTRASTSARPTTADAPPSKSKDRYAELRQAMLREIVEKRLFKEADLRRYLDQVHARARQPPPSAPPNRIPSPPPPSAQAMREKRGHVDAVLLSAVDRDIRAEFFL